MKRQLAIFTVVAGLASCAFAETIDLSTVDTDRVFHNKDVITGTLPSTSKVKLEIEENALITLRNARIDGASFTGDSYKWAGLTCRGNAEIRIDGENHVKGFNVKYPSIYVPENKTLTIRQAFNISGYYALGGGTLTAPGNNDAAGIGAGFNLPCGNIVIESGIIFANGKSAAGIGGAGNAACGDITIKSGVVYAAGTWDAAGIGGCGDAGCGAITIEDGVTLVVAQCSDHNNPSPIGAGGGGTCGAVTVTLAEGATDTTGVTGSGHPIRTIEGRAFAKQYANGLAWDFRFVDGTAEICNYDGYYYGEEHYKMAISDKDYAGTLVIPDTLGGRPVTRIGNSAFIFCKKITGATIPATVTSIGEYAFQYCEKLAAVTIPSSVTTIGERAFENCDGLTGLTIMDGVTAIEERAFAGCDSLASLTIPGSVKRIGTAAFSSCDGLTSLTIMDGVETIGEEAFGWCDSLASVTVPASVKTIGVNAFANCASLATVNGLAEDMAVGDGAFFGCTALADANGFIIVNNVLYQYIGGEAYVTVPAGVTRIGAGAFEMHTSNPVYGAFPPLVGVTIPDSVTSIGQLAFGYCLELEMVTFPANMPRIEDGAFLMCVKLADANGFITIGGPLHMYIGSASEVAIPDGVTSIGPQSFISYTGIPPYYYYYSSATSVTIPSGVTNIAFEAFCYCPVLTTVSIPSTVTSIGPGAFYDGLSGTVPLQAVHVEPGDTERVKGLLLASGHPVDGMTFIEDYNPAPGPGPCYQVLNEGDITAPYAAPKAVTLKGAAYDGCDVVGVVELKLGKVNAKQKTSKVSGSFTGLDGKKRTMKAATVAGVDGTAPATVALEVKGLGTMTVAVGGSQFAGTLGGWHVQSAAVGGNWTKGVATAKVAVGDVSAFGGGVLADLLPTNEVATVTRGRWAFAKAAGVKYAKPKAGQATVTPVDATGKGLIVDTSKNKTNLSGLKFTYTPKSGTFKGSFKVFALNGAKLVKYTMNVSGVVVDGVGYGKATCKRPAVSWPVRVE